MATDAPGATETLKPPRPEAIVPVKKDPEPPERVARTKQALNKLAETAAEHSRPYGRNIEIYRNDPPGPGESRRFEHWVPLHTDNDKLRTIDLKTDVEGDPDAAYRLELSYAPDDNGKPDLSQPLMLSAESPIDWSTVSFKVTGALEAGLMRILEGRRIQDFLFKDGATTIPVREADFTYIHSYREYNPERSYEATKEQMDVMLKLLAGADVMKGEEKMGKASELVPELTALAA